MDYNRFQWRNAESQNDQSPIWQRDIDEVEYMYTALERQYRATGRSFFYVTGHLTLRIATANLPAIKASNQAFYNAMGRAWLALRTKHPAIASQTKWDAASEKWIKEYRPDVTGWVPQTLIFDNSGRTGLEFSNSDPPAPKLPTLFILSPKTNEDDEGYIYKDLVFRSPHDIIDGVGTLHLLNNFAQLAAETLTKGDSFTADSIGEVARLSPPYRIAAKIPSDTTEIVQKRLAQISSVYKSPAEPAFDDAQPIGLPYQKGASLPGKHQRVELILSKDETSRIIAASKKLGATVTHVFHAAIVLVLRDLQEKPKGDTPRHVQYLGYILRNERASCEPPFNDGRLHPAGVYHSVSSRKLVVNMTITPESSAGGAIEGDREVFLDIVRTMKDFYHSVRDDKEHWLLVPYIFGNATPQLPKPTIEPQELAVPPPPELAPVSISSLGNVDAIMAPSYGPVEVYTPWVTGEELKNGIGTFLGTFRGELSFSAAYNDAWHDERDARGFLEQCLAVVRSGLDVN